ncbi:hypothetical protein PIB30_085787 [Stylosanthes scabra]|uniref:Uncharacterized protein n=1 Tax=Stylosanthes scabra TaxID=79078 RepID=A0ABU6XSB5_9FABA|nr:hypothetical protein [Stylosanthes scabra]
MHHLKLYEMALRKKFGSKQGALRRKALSKELNLFATWNGVLKDMSNVKELSCNYDTCGCGKWEAEAYPI